jgi:hypothetical protein
MQWVKGLQEKYAEEAYVVIDAVGQGLEVDRWLILME